MPNRNLQDRKSTDLEMALRMLLAQRASALPMSLSAQSPTVPDVYSSDIRDPSSPRYAPGIEEPPKQEESLVRLLHGLSQPEQSQQNQEALVLIGKALAGSMGDRPARPDVSDIKQKPAAQAIRAESKKPSSNTDPLTTGEYHPSAKSTPKPEEEGGMAPWLKVLLPLLGVGAVAGLISGHKRGKLVQPGGKPLNWGAGLAGGLQGLSQGMMAKQQQEFKAGESEKARQYDWSKLMATLDADQQSTLLKLMQRQSELEAKSPDWLKQLGPTARDLVFETLGDRDLFSLSPNDPIVQKAAAASREIETSEKMQRLLSSLASNGINIALAFELGLIPPGSLMGEFLAEVGMSGGGSANPNALDAAIKGLESGRQAFGGQ